MRSTYLVCYDISDPKRLARVGRAMRGFGDRVQYSVFECRLSATDLARCRHHLGRLIHHHQDQVLFVDLGPADGRGDRVITSLGRAYSTLDSPCIIVDHDSEDSRCADTRRRADSFVLAPGTRSLEEDE